MAISPTEAKKLTEQDLEAVRRFETEIDQSAKGLYVEGVVLRLKLSGTPNTRVWGELSKRYKEAGWESVQLSSGQILLYDKRAYNNASWDR